MMRSAAFKQLLLSSGLTAFFAFPICALLFACGCRHLFAGGAQHCELLPGAVTISHACPWCALTDVGLILTFAPTVSIAGLYSCWVSGRLGGFAASLHNLI